MSRLLAPSASLGLISTHCIGTSFYLNHLQFADDTLLFSKFDQLTLENLFEVVHIFERASDLTINLTKSELLGIHVDVSDMGWMLSKFGCKQGFWPTSYLGLSLGGNCKFVSFLATRH